MRASNKLLPVLDKQTKSYERIKEFLLILLGSPLSCK